MSLNVISPRKSPRRAPVAPPPQTPPQWKKPQDVMNLHRLRLKRNALAARMGVSPKSVAKELVSPKPSAKRKNPFRKTEVRSPSPKKSCDPVAKPPLKKKEDSEWEQQNDEVLFKLLGLEGKEPSFSQDLSFLTLSTSTSVETESCNAEISVQKGSRTLPVDWTLRTKIKFYSRKPFPWNQTLKLCEEASGITGFVRCIQNEDGGLDTSPNATFHECSLYWQHPNLPWLELFPRSKLGKADQVKMPLLTAYPHVKDSLHRDWSESFRALLQLIRARHCPYFYVLANSFNCIFRASGINGCTQINALVNPTTSGFRKLLAADGVSYSMPLRKNVKRISEEMGDDDEELEESEAQAEASDWLASLGVDAEEIKKMSSAEEMFTFKTEKREEGKDESLVLVEGTEVHALFNFLINCKSIVATSGPLTGVPPTLLAPVAFTGGSLMSLKVRQSTVSVENESFHSIELRGPILPQAVHYLCSTLTETSNNFSVTLVNLDTTKAFSSATAQPPSLEEEVTNNMGKKSAKSDDDNDVASPAKLGKGGRAFSMEGLNDCGLKAKTLTSFCSENVTLFDSIKYSNELFTCS